VKVGAIAVSANAKSTAEELGTLLLDSGARVLVTTEGLRDASFPAAGRMPQVEHVLIAEGDAGGDLSFEAAMAAALPVASAMDVPADTPAAILYTSGTTGEAKGATLSHGNVDFVMRAKVECMGVRPEDRLLLFLPMSHCFGQNAILNAAFAAGAAVVLHRRFEIDEVLRSIEQDGATMFFGVPTTFILMLEKATREQLRPLRYFFSAAATLPREVEDRWLARFGSVIYQGYGLTESSPFATYNHIRKHRPGSLGAAVPGVEVAIGDVRDGRILEAGERGEILVRGPNVMLGYWNRPLETAACIRDGWLHTGDIGRMDAEGCVTLWDRLKDMVIVGGVNVYPAEVEQALHQHASVLEVAVYGRADAVLGERVCAAVVLREGESVTSEELNRFCVGRIASYKIPTEIAVVEALPKGPTGKVLKRVLRERAVVVNAPERMRRTAEGERPVANVRELEQNIAQWLSATLEVDKRIILPNIPFAEYGVTSLMAVELAGRLCDWLGRAVSPTIAWQFPTIASLARHSFLKVGGQSLGKAPASLSLAHLSESEAEVLLREELARMGVPGEPA
jgi:long-chain acyl-CoA synthetase